MDLIKKPPLGDDALETTLRVIIKDDDKGLFKGLNGFCVINVVTNPMISYHGTKLSFSVLPKQRTFEILQQMAFEPQNRGNFYFDCEVKLKHGVLSGTRCFVEIHHFLETLNSVQLQGTFIIDSETTPVLNNSTDEYSKDYNEALEYLDKFLAGTEL